MRQNDSFNIFDKASEMTPLWPQTEEGLTEGVRWDLFQHEPDARYLLVGCGDEPAKFYDALIRLNEYELRDYGVFGRLSIVHLALRVRYFEDEYRPRHVHGDLLTKALWMRNKRMPREDRRAFRERTLSGERARCGKLAAPVPYDDDVRGRCACSRGFDYFELEDNTPF